MRKAAQAGIDLSFLRTIPGAIGGAVAMNAGCYGDYISDVFVSAEGIARDGTPLDLGLADMNFPPLHGALKPSPLMTALVAPPFAIRQAHPPPGAAMIRTI